ncbi:HEPN domain-containing protein [Sulfurospirillum sp. 1307]|jgi:HEPN domain-containing protein
MNKSSAQKWLVKAWHNLSGAKIFYKANHYTDVTAVELHYTVEKLLKSFIAYENKKIPKTHNLIELSGLIIDFIKFSEEEFDLLDIISGYHIEESYPMPDRTLPSKEEIKEILDFADNLLEKVCKILEVDIDEIKK